MYFTKKCFFLNVEINLDLKRNIIYFSTVFFKRIVARSYYFGIYTREPIYFDGKIIAQPRAANDSILLFDPCAL